MASEEPLEADVVAIYRALVIKAKGGDVQAAKLIIERLCGPVPIDVAVQSASLEELVMASYANGRDRPS